MEDKIEKYLDKSLTRFMNKDTFKEIYPMINKFEVYDLDIINAILIKIFTNDSELNNENMYQKGLDPHYLIDRYLAKFLPYFNVPRTKKVHYVIIGPNSEVIDKWEGSF